ncbi:hypothetical protein [Dysgonomonas termitidis]|uniref:Nuclear transport factor 2 family protein n=1 Tax=Dysgonomonas termitidis TaxID=1516126 RepID=A0ABV9L433_9BACT
MAIVFAIIALGLCVYISTLRHDSTLAEPREATEKTIEELRKLVFQWNDAHLSKDTGLFSDLFNGIVLFYGTQLDKNICIEKKISLFSKIPDFKQAIFGNIDVEKISDAEYRCNFMKRVTADNNVTDYPSYLVFREINGDWKIVTESDLITDKNLAKQRKK